jgi:hypothetical protein
VAADNTGDERDRPLLLDELGDRLDRFHLLAATDDAAADRLLNDLGGSGKVEREMLLELAAAHPLAHPERMAEAHAVAMRALEVLARNGSRPPSQLRVGPLTGVARWVVQQVIRYIVRSHQSRVVDSIRDLYARRLGWVPVGDPARLTLVRARLDVERASPAFKKNAGGIPTFLVGGAAVSSLAQVARSGASATAGSRAGLIAAGLGTFLLLAALSWAILRGAAIARRRIRLTLDRPLGALWETVGWCGHPPRDAARTFAVVAIALTAVGWVLIPLATLAVVALF